jgi:hypothetical protein
MKLCISCEVPKAHDAFYAGRNQCIPCVRAIERDRYARNRAARQETARAYWQRQQARRNTLEVSAPPGWR